MATHILKGSLLLAGLALASAHPARPTDPIASAALGELRWVPKETLPPGAFAAVAHGDPHTGAYVFYARFPEGFHVPPHWHSHDVEVVLLRGGMRIERDGKPPLVVGEHDYVHFPAGERYAASCPAGCLFVAWGDQPFDIAYVDPADDPRPPKSPRN